MADLRQILSQGKKRIGLLIGAGAPVSIVDDNDKPLIPDVRGLTDMVRKEIPQKYESAISMILQQLGINSNIEDMLTQVRKLSQAIGTASVHGLDGAQYGDLANIICKRIADKVSRKLPSHQNPYTALTRWIGGTSREYAVEIFTPNYDLLMEEALEKAKLPYFDGFIGAHRPFFDPSSVAENDLPARWSRLWKIHGSLGWNIKDNSIIRTGNRKHAAVIYPDHLKYDQITRQPYSALFERLRTFLMEPDGILLCTGFSFSDAQITAVLDETLSANAHMALIAFQFRDLCSETQAVSLALSRPNMSVYAPDGAIVSGVEGRWAPGDPPNKEWETIRRTFWTSDEQSQRPVFSLGNFVNLTRFFELSQSEAIQSTPMDVHFDKHSPGAANPDSAPVSLTEADDVKP